MRIHIGMFCALYPRHTQFDNIPYVRQKIVLSCIILFWLFVIFYGDGESYGFPLHPGFYLLFCL